MASDIIALYAPTEIVPHSTLFGNAVLVAVRYPEHLSMYDDFNGENFTRIVARKPGNPLLYSNRIHPYALIYLDHSSWTLTEIGIRTLYDGGYDAMGFVNSRNEIVEYFLRDPDDAIFRAEEKRRVIPTWELQDAINELGSLEEVAKAYNTVPAAVYSRIKNHNRHDGCVPVVPSKSMLDAISVDILLRGIDARTVATAWGVTVPVLGLWLCER